MAVKQKAKGWLWLRRLLYPLYCYNPVTGRITPVQPCLWEKILRWVGWIRMT